MNFSGSLPRLVAIILLLSFAQSTVSAYPNDDTVRRLQKKQRQVQCGIQRWRQSGRDPAPLGERLQKFEPLIRAGDYKRAEAILDAALQELNRKQKPVPYRRKPVLRVLITPSPGTPKNARSGLDGNLESMSMITSKGVNTFAFSNDWRELERTTSDGAVQFTLQGQFKNPLTLLVPRFPEIDGVIYVLKMIDTNWRPLPNDLKNRGFADPEIGRRFAGLIDALAREPCSRRLDYVLLGNEIDGYLGMHPEEVEPFLQFYANAKRRIKRRLPGIRVGTIITFSGAVNNRALFGRVKELSDFLCFTYYPVKDLERGNCSKEWQMQPVGAVEHDLKQMAKIAAPKKFAFTEIGYSASPMNGSSQEQQAAFVSEMFRVLDPYRRADRIEFILYHKLYDYPDDMSRSYARAQGVPSRKIVEFMTHMGLFDYNTGKPRRAWKAFVDGLADWRSEEAPGK